MTAFMPQQQSWIAATRSHRTCKVVWLFIENICWLYLRYCWTLLPWLYPLPHKLPITDRLPVFHTPSSGTVTSETKNLMSLDQKYQKLKFTFCWPCPIIGRGQDTSSVMHFWPRQGIWRQTLTLRLHYLTLEISNRKSCDCFEIGHVKT